MLISVILGYLLPGKQNANQSVLVPKSLPTPSQQAHTRPFALQMVTSDQAFQVQLNASPNQFGPNVFTVIPAKNKEMPASVRIVSVDLYLTSLDMDMGVEHVALQEDSNGNFSQQVTLWMDGNWQARIALYTSAKTLHEAIIRFFTPA